jgi:hypothetical protein
MASPTIDMPKAMSGISLTSQIVTAAQERDLHWIFELRL